MYALLGLLGVVLLGGIAATYWVWRAAEREHRAILLERTATAAAAVDPNVLAALSGAEADLANPNYLHLKELLTRLRHATADVRFVYVVRRVGNKVIFLCDSEPPDSADYSPPGQVYDEATEVFRAALAAGKPAVVGPASDRWGTWITGVIPLFDKDGHPADVVCCDMDAGYWASRIALSALTPILICLLLVALLLLFHVMYSREERAFETLRQNEAWFRTLYEMSPIGIELYDSEGRMTHANQACLRMFGVSDFAELKGLNLFENPLLPDELKEQLRAGEEVRYECLYDFDLVRRLRYRTSKSGTIYLDALFTPLAIEQGQTFGYMLQLEDITERRRAEEALQRSADEMQMIFKNMLNAFIVWESVFDEKGNYVSFRFGYFNDAYARISGLCYEDVRGKDVFEVWPDTEQSWVEAYGEVALTGVPKTFEMYHVSTDGTYYCNAYRPWDSPDRICVIFEDITSRKRAEEEHRRLEEQLAQSQKMESVGRLAGGVAHDFNNLLAVILGHGELLLADLPDDSPMREELIEIMAAGNRAKDLTRQLLAFSRKQVLDMKPLDLNAVVRGIEKMIRRLIGEDIEIKVSANLSIGLVNADPSQIEQAIINLCVNARDAMPGGGTLVIATDTALLDEHYAAANPGVQAGSYAVLSVSDTGAGMDEETQRRIFDPFFTTKETGKGTGLGLSTVYGIVKQHGGTLSVYSEPGHGSVFKLYFPCLENVEIDEGTETDEKAIPGNGEVILLMEDDGAVRKLTVEMLSHLGYSVIEARTIEQCFELAQHAPRIDLLLTDVIMPSMNGRQVYDRVVSLRPGAKVLFMSGYTDDVIARHGILDKGVYFLSKPFTRNALSRRIREVLSS